MQKPNKLEVAKMFYKIIYACCPSLSQAQQWDVSHNTETETAHDSIVRAPPLYILPLIILPFTQLEYQNSQSDHLSLCHIHLV